MANRFADAMTINELLDQLISVAGAYGFSDGDAFNIPTASRLRTQARERLNQILAAGSDLDDIRQQGGRLMANRFANASTIDDLFGQLAGAASVCWENPGGAGIFDSVQASTFCTEAKERLNQILAMHPDMETLDLLAETERQEQFSLADHAPIGSGELGETLAYESEPS